MCPLQQDLRVVEEDVEEHVKSVVKEENAKQKAKNTKSLLAIWEQMKERSFLNYNIDVKAQDKNIEEFKSLELTQQKELLVELLDKNQMYVNLSSMDDSDFEVTDEEKRITKEFYNIS